MKTIIRIALLLVCIVTTALTYCRGQELPQVDSEPFATDLTLALGVDPDTFEVKIADFSSPLMLFDISVFNTPEEIEIRRTAYLALYDPEEYWRQHPKTEEQLIQEAIAGLAVLIPRTEIQKAAEQTPEQNAADQKAWAEFFNVHPDSTQNNDPRGPGAAPSAEQAPSAEAIPGSEAPETAPTTDDPPAAQPGSENDSQK